MQLGDKKRMKGALFSVHKGLVLNLFLRAVPRYDAFFSLSEKTHGTHTLDLSLFPFLFSRGRHWAKEKSGIAQFCVSFFSFLRASLVGLCIFHAQKNCDGAAFDAFFSFFSFSFFGRGGKGRRELYFCFSSSSRLR